MEYWIESDLEIDEDMVLEDSNILPSPNLDASQDMTEEVNRPILWIVTLLSIFQMRFRLTNRALSWLLVFIFVILRFLGRYSTNISELAIHFPKTLHQYGFELAKISPIVSFQRRVVCTWTWKITCINKTRYFSNS